MVTAVIARPNEYFRSLAAEFDVQAMRVRQLIGDAHWGNDGNHKEALVRGLLEAHVPAGVLVTRAFLVSTLTPTNCSREQDVVVLDHSSDAPLFRFGGLAISSVESALVSVSVKTQFGKAEFIDSMTSFATVPTTPGAGSMFFGVYHFPDADKVSDDLEPLATKIRGWMVDAPRISVVLRISPSILGLIDVRTTPGTLHLYQTDDASTAFFLARMLNHIATSRAGRPSFFADALDAVEDVVTVCRVPLDG